MIPSGRLVLLASVPTLLALVWVVVPAVLPVMAAVDGVLVALALLDLLRSGGAVHVTREHGALQSVGAPFEVRLVVRNDCARPLHLRIDDDAPGHTTGLPASLDLGQGGAVAVTYARTLHRRGRYVFGAVTARWASPWGLWWRQARHPALGQDQVRVYPDFTHLRSHGLKARQDERRMPVRARRRPGGESEFQRLRQYVPGDPYRHIDWKATARRQKFVTREFGQESNQNVIFLLDAGRSMTMQLGDLTAFDHALNAALAMGHAALRHGDRVGLLAFDSQVRAWLPPRGGVRSGAGLIQATYDVFPSLDEPDYAAAFRHLSTSVRRRSLVVLVTAMSDQVNAEAATAVVRALGSRHLPLAVWLRDPRLDAVLATPAEDEEGFFERCAVAELARWREAAMADWRRRGALVVDVAPDQLSSALLGQYLEIKARKLL